MNRAGGHVFSLRMFYDASNLVLFGGYIGVVIAVEEKQQALAKDLAQDFWNRVVALPEANAAGVFACLFHRKRSKPESPLSHSKGF